MSEKIDYKNSWMYGSIKWKLGFWQEVDRFIEAQEKHSMTFEYKNEIHCPCNDCKNIFVMAVVVYNCL
jgi:hypothetical protein